VLVVTGAPTVTPLLAKKLRDFGSPQPRTPIAVSKIRARNIFMLLPYQRLGSGDGEREASMTRQIAFEPLPASVLLNEAATREWRSLSGWGDIGVAGFAKCQSRSVGGAWWPMKDIPHSVAGFIRFLNLKSLRARILGVLSGVGQSHRQTSRHCSHLTARSGEMLNFLQRSSRPRFTKTSGCIHGTRFSSFLTLANPAKHAIPPERSHHHPTAALPAPASAQTSPASHQTLPPRKPRSPPPAPS
jgi:hypothetical protein